MPPAGLFLWGGAKCMCCSLFSPSSPHIYIGGGTQCPPAHCPLLSSPRWGAPALCYFCTIVTNSVKKFRVRRAFIIPVFQFRSRFH